jgi:hypothetical protein
VLVAIAGAATAEHYASSGPRAAELALGLLIGAAIGGGGWLVKMARGRGWVAEGFAGHNRTVDRGLGVKGRSWSPPLLTTPLAVALWNGPTVLF